MLVRSSLVLAALAASVVLAPAPSLSQEEAPRFRCGERYMTLMVTGGSDSMKAGPLSVRKSDVRAIYVARGNKLTMLIDIGKFVLRPTIEPEMIRPVMECLD